MPLKYNQSFEVLQFECDPWDRMTPGAVLRRVQEIGTAQTESLGFNEEFYKNTHTVFLLSKISLKINRAPRLGEKVEIETRAYGMRRAVYHRVTSLHSQSGEKLCEADSRWLLVDTSTRRILRTPTEEIAKYFNEEPAEEHVCDIPKAPEGLAELENLRASYTLCDRNGHVNNTRYADFVCDALPITRLEEGLPQQMVFHFRSEIPLNENFALWGAQIDENSYYYLAQQEKSKNFEAYVRF